MGRGQVEGLDDIVDRAIDYTGRILDVMPGYRTAAINGLTRLSEALARRHPDDPALTRLDAYLNSLKSERSFPPP